MGGSKYGLNYFTPTIIIPEMKDKIGTWYGKPVSKLSRKELLKVIECLAEENERLKRESCENPLEHIRKD